MPDQFFIANVKRMSGALDLRLRSEKVEMDVPNISKKLLPGMIAEVHIPLPAAARTFVIPKGSVLETAEGIHVLKSQNNKLKKCR